MKTLRNLSNSLAFFCVALTISAIAIVRWLFNRPCVLCLTLLCSSATAQDGWTGHPGEYLGHGPDVRLVWDWQPEYRPCPGRYYRDYYGQLFYAPPTNCFTGRVTLQPQRRVYYDRIVNGQRQVGWYDADYVLFR